MPWLDQFNREKPRDAEALLKTSRDTEWRALVLYSTYLGLGVTVAMATLGGALASSRGGETRIGAVIAMFTPLLIASVKWFILASLDRYYARFLEEVVVQKKLRFAIERPTNAAVPFASDETLDVPRHWGLPPSGESSQWVANLMKKGHNEISHIAMAGFFILSFVTLPVSIAALSEAFAIFSWQAAIVATLAVAVPIAAVALNRKSTNWIASRREASYGKPS